MVIEFCKAGTTVHVGYMHHNLSPKLVVNPHSHMCVCVSEVDVCDSVVCSIPVYCSLCGILIQFSMYLGIEFNCESSSVPTALS